MLPFKRRKIKFFTNFEEDTKLVKVSIWWFLKSWRMANFVRSFLNEKVAKGDASGPHDLNAKQTRYLKAIHVHIKKKKEKGKNFVKKISSCLAFFILCWFLVHFLNWMNPLSSYNLQKHSHFIYLCMYLLFLPFRTKIVRILKKYFMKKYECSFRTDWEYSFTHCIF